jgi:acyl-CoA reductase-like NAD-dependent aldehyde dehydrogenase
MTSPDRVPPVHLHIGDQLIAEGTGGSHMHIWPANGAAQGPVPLAGPDQVGAAVDAAAAAFPEWRAWKPAERARVLRRLAEVVRADREELARLCVLDNAMTLGMGQIAADVLADYTDYYAGWADKIEGRVTSTPGQSRELAYTVPEPYGVVAVIMTWNSPLFSVGMKLIPALAAGNTVVLKPSELTPYSSERFMRLVRDAGIPAGVVNLLIGGPDTGDALVRHPVVQKVSFTGGPATAKKILAACAESLKPAVLELGGKSANLVFPDANLDVAALVNAFSVCGVLGGQGCAIPSRMLVHDDVYDDVAGKVIDAVRNMPLGDPFDPATVISPLVTRAAQERVLAMIERAQADGAGKLLLGGGVPGGDFATGFYVEPTVFGDVDPASELAQVEVFGPVLSLLRFSTEDEAVRIANSTPYGLASYVWTQDAARISRLATQLHAGGVYVNGAPPVISCELPFGGVGISGYGREGGREGLFEFLRTKAVAIA